MVEEVLNLRVFVEDLMADGKQYNGWTNYATWCWALWIDNDQGTQEMWVEQAAECWKETEGEDLEDRKYKAALMLAERLKEDAEENNPLSSSGPYTDLLGSALGEIDWYEIAEHMIYDLDKDE